MIDWSRVASLRDEVGADDFQEVVSLFLEEADAAVSDLGTAGPDMLEAQLHFLKGSALSLGFTDFARLCEEGERAAGAGTPDSVELSALLDCYAGSRRAFVEGVSEQAAA